MVRFRPTPVGVRTEERALSGHAVPSSGAGQALPPSAMCRAAIQPKVRPEAREKPVW